MTIHQLSIFVENKQGTLIKVLQLLKEANVQLIASTIADTVEYGIYRIICSEPDRAYEILRDQGISVALSEVFALELDDKVGRAADTLALFSKEGINIAYMYSFLLHGKGILVFRTDNEQHTREVIEKADLKFIPEKDLSKY
ncbi:MAG: amino acid-binding protein [Bacteroidales bacterium]|nr:amino acid-binding protein [Candidatus Cacconaster equi]